MHTIPLLLAVMRIGVIGLDTSHSIAFTKQLNTMPEKTEYRDFRVVAAVVHGSRDIASSTKRYPASTAKMQEMGVEIVPDVDTLLGRVDAVLLETNDGREHLWQAEKVFRAGKRVFIDKPLAHNLADSVAIVRLAKKYNATFFSSSAIRYVKAIRETKAKGVPVRGMDCWTCLTVEPTHELWYWYGIHSVDPIFAVLGRGCEEVSSLSSSDGVVAIGKWNDGRFGIARGLSTARGGAPYGGVIFTEEGQVDMGSYEGYVAELDAILEYFRTGVVPVDPEETIEVMAFMTAARISSENGGRAVRIADVLKQL